MFHSRFGGAVAFLTLSLTAFGVCGSSPAQPEEGGRATTAPAVNVEWIRFVDEFIEAY